ncbi:MAG TPA: HAD family phosphatase [Vicinamibacterales bacterium]|nr:HAD family phosphatase [Vicinamibacterales bacterium]
MPTSSLQAVVFDFDGVIADTEPLHLRAYQDILAEAGITLTEMDYYARYLGYDDAGAFRAIARDSGRALDEAALRDFIARKSRRFEELEAAGAVLFPGAVACVRRCAAHWPLAVASGALRREIELVLEHAGLRDCFQLVVSAEDTPKSKPAPDPYRLALEKLRDATGADIAASRTVAIEDSRWGIQSARGAGLRCVAVTHSYGADALGEADAIVPNLDALTIDRLQDLAG